MDDTRIPEPAPQDYIAALAAQRDNLANAAVNLEAMLASATRRIAELEAQIAGESDAAGIGDALEPEV